jgi:hypothetical protein
MSQGRLVIRLEQDDPASIRMATAGQRSQHLCVPERHSGSEGGAEEGNHISIPACIRDEEENRFGISIATLERKSPLERLGIAHAGFRLHGHEGSRWILESVDHGVPRSAISRQCKRDFGTPPQRGRDSAFQALQQRVVGSISQRIAHWVQTDRQIKPQGGSASTQLVDGKVGNFSSLQAPELGMRQTRRSTKIPQRDARTHSREPDLLAHVERKASSLESAQVRSSLRSAHASRSWSTGLHPPLSRPLVRDPRQTTDRWPDARSQAVVWSAKRAIWSSGSQVTARCVGSRPIRPGILLAAGCLDRLATQRGEPGRTSGLHIGRALALEQAARLRDESRTQ